MRNDVDHPSPRQRLGQGKRNSWRFDDAGVLRFKTRVYVPLEPALRAELFKLYHDDPLAGHFGRAKTLELLSWLYYWLNIEKDLKEYINSCRVC